MNAVVIFEVSSQADEVIQTLKQNGFHSSWVGGGKPYDLPKYSLWKPDTELQASINEVKKTIDEMNAANGSNIVLLKCIALPSSPWSGIARK